MPAERLPITLKAEGVRSMIRFEPQVDPQHVVRPQKSWVAGPQSAIEADTHLPLQRFVMKSV